MTTSSPPRLRAVVADDSVLLRDGLVRLLAEADIEVASAVGDVFHIFRIERRRPCHWRPSGIWSGKCGAPNDAKSGD